MMTSRSLGEELPLYGEQVMKGGPFDVGLKVVGIAQSHVDLMVTILPGMRFSLMPEGLLVSSTADPVSRARGEVIHLVLSDPQRVLLFGVRVLEIKADRNLVVFSIWRENMQVLVRRAGDTLAFDESTLVLLGPPRPDLSGVSMKVILSDTINCRLMPGSEQLAAGQHDVVRCHDEGFQFTCRKTGEDHPPTWRMRVLEIGLDRTLLGIAEPESLVEYRDPVWWPEVLGL